MLCGKQGLIQIHDSLSHHPSHVTEDLETCLRVAAGQLLEELPAKHKDLPVTHGPYGCTSLPCRSEEGDLSKKISFLEGSQSLTLIYNFKQTVQDDIYFPFFGSTLGDKVPGRQIQNES